MLFVLIFKDNKPLMAVYIAVSTVTAIVVIVAVIIVGLLIKRKRNRTRKTIRGDLSWLIENSGTYYKLSCKL